MIRNKYLFYALSFTWGITMSLFGCIIAIVLLTIGCRPEKYGYCLRFEFQKHWGGLNLGPIIITSVNPSEHTKQHEHGHSIQNCIYGPFMLIISIMSVSRYWYRELKYHNKGLTPPTEYDDAWYEGSASLTGIEFMNWYNNNTK